MDNNPIVFSGNKHIDSAVTSINMIYVGMKTGSRTIDDIVYHTPMGEGDSHFVDVFYDDGSVTRMFDIQRLSWSN